MQNLLSVMQERRKLVIATKDIFLNRQDGFYFVTEIIPGCGW